MTETTERRITWDELHRMVIECEHCHTELNIEFDKDDQRRRVSEKDAPRLVCALCGTQSDTALMQAFQYFHLWRLRIRDSKATVSFRIPVSASHSSP